MIPMLQAALLVRAADDPDDSTRPVLVARPGGVVHVAVAPPTPSGRFIPVAARTVCRTRTRRLGVIPRGSASDLLRGRRVCVRCTKILAGRVLGLDGKPMPRDVELKVFGFLTLRNLVTLAKSCATVQETHQVGRLAMMLYGPAPVKAPARRTPAEAERADLEQLILRVRRHLVAAERTPEEREAAQRRRETEAFNDALSESQRRRAVAIENAEERRQRGGYLTAAERELVKSA